VRWSRAVLSSIIFFSSIDSGIGGRFGTLAVFGRLGAFRRVSVEAYPYLRAQSAAVSP
jgi:hypothetical protein